MALEHASSSCRRWRWSAAFFALLARTNRRPELKWWARAWAFNLLAILVTSLFWALQSAALLPIVSRLVYVGGKSAFTLLLMQGAWAMIRPGGRLFTTRALTIGVIVYAVAAAVDPARCQRRSASRSIR